MKPMAVAGLDDVAELMLHHCPDKRIVIQQVSFIAKVAAVGAGSDEITDINGHFYFSLVVHKVRRVGCAGGFQRRRNAVGQL